MQVKKWKRLMKQSLAVSLAFTLWMSTGQITAFAESDETGKGTVVSEEPKAEAPETEEPKAEASGTEEPKAEAPGTEGPKAEAPETEGPKAEASGTEGPKAETPETEGPKAEAPETEGPKTEPPKTEEPKAEAPGTEGPKAEEHIHNWDEGVVTEEATCSKTGVKTYTCQEKDCGETKTEELPMTEHQDENKSEVCSVCGACLADAGSEAVQTFLTAVEALKKWEAKEDASEEEMEKMLADYQASFEQTKTLYSNLTDGQKMLEEVQKAYGDLTDIEAALNPLALAENEDCLNGTCSHVAAVGETHYATLQEAFDAADGNDVVMLSDIKGMTTDAIATVAEGSKITFDMDGHVITVDESFAGRPIVNKGTLTVKGNGIIDSSASKNGYGAIRNDGTLTVEDGRYIGSVYGDGAAIRNGIGSHLTVNGGYFAGTGAIYNVGEAVIYKGEFETLACSGCRTPWAYALNNRDENGVSGTMQIIPANDEDVKVHGPQGALASVGGAKVQVDGGTFYTHPCRNNHAGSTFYALYVSGKEGLDAATCVVNGGKFSTTGEHACVYLVNENPGDNGGQPGNAVVQINGGSFDQGSASKLINFNDKPGGVLEITQGEFIGTAASADVAPYIDSANVLLDEGGKLVVAPRTAESEDTIAEVGGKYYASLQDAVDAAGNSTTVTLMKDAGWSAAEGDILIEKTLILDLAGKALNITGVGTNGITVQEGGSLTIQNGKITANDVASVANPVIEVTTGSSLALNNIKSFDTNGTALFPRGDAAKVTVVDSEINAPNSYAVATNASGSENYQVVIDLKNSTFTGNSPILLNVPGKLTADNCLVSGQMHGIIVRGGEADIRNSTVVQNYPGTDAQAQNMANYFNDRNWGSGNMVNLAAITIGNKGNAYQYPSNVRIVNTNVKAEGANNNLFPCVYVYANESEGNGVTLNMAGNTLTGGTDPQIVYGNETNVTMKEPVAKVGSEYFDTLQEAVNAAEAGGTVTLLKDVVMDNTAENKHISVTKKLTLNLNGHNIERGTNNTGSCLINSNGGDLTIEGNGTIDGAATFVNDSKTYVGEGVRASNNGKITINSGVVVKGGYAVRLYQGCSAVIDGASVEGTTNGILGSGVGALIQVDGGTVKAANGTAIQAQLGANVTINGGTVTSPKMAINGLTNGKDKMGTITINGGLVESASYSESNPQNLGAVVANSYHVVIAGGEIKGPYTVSMSTFNGNNSAAACGTSTLVMTGGKIDATIQAIGVNNLDSAGATAEISGGTITVPNDRTAIYWPAEGTLTISGSTSISGGTGIEMKMGTLNIEGGTIVGNGAYAAIEPANGGAGPEGSALLVAAQMYDNCLNSPDLTVNITGGNLTSGNGNAITIYNTRQKDVPAAVNISGGKMMGVDGKNAFYVFTAESTDVANRTTYSISGGTFSSVVPAEYCAEGYELVDNGDNTYSVKSTKPDDTGDTPGGDTPGGDTPGSDTPGGDTPGGDTPGGDTPGGDTPGGDTPGGDTPGGDTPGGDIPGGDTPGGGTTGGNTPGGDTPGGDTTGGNTPGGNTPGGGTTGGGTTGGNTPGNNAPVPAAAPAPAAAPTIITPALTPAAAVTAPAATPAPAAVAEDEPAAGDVMLEDEEVPLADGGQLVDKEEPEAEEPESVILEDEETPLASGKSSNWVLLCVIPAALAAFIIFILLRRKKEEEEEEA